MDWKAFRDRLPGHTRVAALALAAVALLLAVTALRPELAGRLALALAVPAFLLGCFALVKGRMLEFCPDVLAGDVILPRAADGERVRLLLPLQFNNTGHADGIIEWLALRMTREGPAEQPVLLSPVAEVDMQRFLQAKRKLGDDSTIEHFAGFALEGRRATAKFVLFDHAERRRVGPLELRPGRYRFELFVKGTHARKPQLARSFEHVLDADQLGEFHNGSTVYLINYDLSLPGVRRSVAGAEWLPRATTA
jgi:hypothetical protein